MKNTANTEENVYFKNTFFVKTKKMKSDSNQRPRTLKTRRNYTESFQSVYVETVEINKPKSNEELLAGYPKKGEMINLLNIKTGYVYYCEVAGYGVKGNKIDSIVIVNPYSTKAKLSYFLGEWEIQPIIS